MADDQTTTLRQAMNALWSEKYGIPFDEWISDRRDRGQPWRGIEREVLDTCGVAISHRTLINWYVPEPAGDAA